MGVLVGAVHSDGSAAGMVCVQRAGSLLVADAGPKVEETIWSRLLVRSLGLAALSRAPLSLLFRPPSSFLGPVIRGRLVGLGGQLGAVTNKNEQEHLDKRSAAEKVGC